MKPMPFILVSLSFGLAGCHQVTWCRFPNDSQFTLYNASGQAIRAIVSLHTHDAWSSNQTMLAPGETARFSSSAETHIDEHAVTVYLSYESMTRDGPVMSAAETTIHVPTDQMNNQHYYSLTVEDGKVVVTETSKSGEPLSEPRSTEAPVAESR